MRSQLAIFFVTLCFCAGAMAAASVEIKWLEPDKFSDVEAVQEKQENYHRIERQFGSGWISLLAIAISVPHFLDELFQLKLHKMWRNFERALNGGLTSDSFRLFLLSCDIFMLSFA